MARNVIATTTTRRDSSRAGRRDLLVRYLPWSDVVHRSAMKSMT